MEAQCKICKAARSQLGKTAPRFENFLDSAATQRNVEHRDGRKGNRALFREHPEDVGQRSQARPSLAKCQPGRKEEGCRKKLTSPDDADDSLRLQGMNDIHNR